MECIELFLKNNLNIILFFVFPKAFRILLLTQSTDIRWLILTAQLIWWGGEGARNDSTLYLYVLKPGKKRGTLG